MTWRLDNEIGGLEVRTSFNACKRKRRFPAPVPASICFSSSGRNTSGEPTARLPAADAAAVLMLSDSDSKWPRTSLNRSTCPPRSLRSGFVHLVRNESSHATSDLANA